MSDYKDYKKPYEFGYIDTYSVDSWWKMVEQKDNWIKEIALLINSITPHNVGCERVFQCWVGCVKNVGQDYQLIECMQWPPFMRIMSLMHRPK